MAPTAAEVNDARRFPRQDHRDPKQFATQEPQHSRYPQHAANHSPTATAALHQQYSPGREAVLYPLEDHPPAPAHTRYGVSPTPGHIHEPEGYGAEPSHMTSAAARYAHLRHEGPPLGAGVGSPEYRLAGANEHTYTAARGHRVPVMNQPPSPRYAGYY